MRFGLSTLALAMFLLGLILAGVANNPLSIFFLLLAMGSWLAIAKARGVSFWLGLLSFFGWILAAAVIAVAFRA